MATVTKIDPDKITKYGLSRSQLEANAVFWIAVAGKTAATISPRIDAVLHHLHWLAEIKGWHPFRAIAAVGQHDLGKILQRYGIGCYSAKSRGMYWLAVSGIDLRRCSVKELDDIFGIGLKTASCFVMHTRPEARCAGLDTHILKFLRALGHDVPASTPGSDRKYHLVEDIFLGYVDRSGRTAAKLDLIVWRAYAHHKHLVPWLVRIFSNGTNSQNIKPVDNDIQAA